MGVSKNRGFVPPKSSHFNRDFPSFHHPFWGENPLFLETSSYVFFFLLFVFGCLRKKSWLVTLPPYETFIMFTDSSRGIFVGGTNQEINDKIQLTSISWMWPHHRMPVTTWIITFLVGDSYKPLFGYVWIIFHQSKLGEHF